MPNSKTMGLCSQQQCLSHAIEWTWLSPMATGIATLTVPYTEMLDKLPSIMLHYIHSRLSCTIPLYSYQVNSYLYDSITLSLTVYTNTVTKSLILWYAVSTKPYAWNDILTVPHLSLLNYHLSITDVNK